MQMNCGRQLLQKHSPAWAHLKKGHLSGPEERSRQLQSELCPWLEVPKSCRWAVMETLTVSMATAEQDRILEGNLGGTGVLLSWTPAFGLHGNSCEVQAVSGRVWDG